MMPLMLDKLRADTPGCRHVTHFNNAGAALQPRTVSERVIRYLTRESDIGGYEAQAEAHEEIESTYQAIAQLIGASSDEIALFENATQAWDMAFYGIPFQQGDRILTAHAEYASNFIAYLQMAKKQGVHIEAIPNDAYGQADVHALRNMLDDRVRLISITHVPTHNGLVNPAVAIGQIAREAQCLYLLNACQSVGQMPINVQEIGCHFLSATGRKYLRGPRGTGFLYASNTTLTEVEPPFLDLHSATWTAAHHFTIRSDARRFENWESNIASKLGLGVAVRYALEIGLDTIWQRVSMLAERLRVHLSDVAGVTLHDVGAVRCGIVTFTVNGKTAQTVKDSLTRQAINTSVSIADYARLDMEQRGLTSVIRASVHYYNTEEELLKLVSAVADECRN